jgi:hypothetical protein
MACKTLDGSKEPPNKLLAHVLAPQLIPNLHDASATIHRVVEGLRTAGHSAETLTEVLSGEVSILQRTILLEARDHRRQLAEALRKRRTKGRPPNPKRNHILLALYDAALERRPDLRRTLPSQIGKWLEENHRGQAGSDPSGIAKQIRRLLKKRNHGLYGLAENLREG